MTCESLYSREESCKLWPKIYVITNISTPRVENTVENNCAEDKSIVSVTYFN
jgi:hypothetical protein